jgi:HNH endonuclease
VRARLAFGEVAGSATATVPDAVERRYALRLVKQRLHQASFRDAVLANYDHRCAISNMPEDHLLDAAHIMADAHELLGQPMLPNGIALSKIHHAAFDNHLIGIDPDSRVHVSERLLMLQDGPLLEQSLKAIEGRVIRLKEQRAPPGPGPARRPVRTVQARRLATAIFACSGKGGRGIRSSSAERRGAIGSRGRSDRHTTGTRTNWQLCTSASLSRKRTLPRLT